MARFVLFDKVYELYKNYECVLINTFLCFLCIISSTGIVVGLSYECKSNDFIRTWPIIFGIIGNISIILAYIYKTRYNNDNEPLYIIQLCIIAFLLGWIIMGYAAFGILNGENYDICDKTLYLFTHWYFISISICILISVTMILIIAICALYALK